MHQLFAASPQSRTSTCDSSSRDSRFSVGPIEIRASNGTRGIVKADKPIELAAKALVMVGEHDLGFHQAAEVMAAKLPDARSERIANGGHILNIEVADHFNSLVAAFLAELA